MNRGTVQDWMDKDRLSASGMLSVAHALANALAYMHQKGLTHNDIKPANVLLAQRVNDTEVDIKLSDLGTTTKSSDRANDYSQYGMTVFCMSNGEKFGTRKFQEELIPGLVEEVAVLTQGALEMPSAGAGTRSVSDALSKLPSLLEDVWTRSVTMSDVRDYTWLQGWGFFDA